MTADSLRFAALDIRRAPGFETDGFRVEDLSEGVTIVHGPNACGKTTMATTLHETLWPGTVERECEIIAQLSLNGDSWRVEAIRGRGQYQRDGEPANAPGLPPAEARDRYLLSLHELLDHETRNESFAETIERETAGGYDVRTAAAELGYRSDPRTRGISEVTAVEQAFDAVQEARKRAAALLEKERRLPVLERRREAAQSGRTRVSLLEQAINYATVREELREAEETLDGFPAILADLDGNEADRVEQLTDEIEELQRTKDAAIKTREDAMATIEETGLPDGGVSSGELTELDERVDRLDSLETTLTTLTSDLESAKARRRKAFTDISAEIDESQLEALDPDVWDDMDSFIETVIAVREERALLDGLEQWYRTESKPDVDRSTLEAGKNALESWLKEPSATSADDRTPLAIGSAAGLVLIFLGVYLGITTALVYFGLVVIGVGFAVYGYLKTAAGTTAGDERTYRTTFENSGLEPPAEWAPDAVRDRVTALNKSLAELEYFEQLEQRRAAWEQSLDIEDLEAREAEIEAKRQELCRQLGVDLETSVTKLLAITRAILRWQDHHDEVVKYETEIETIRDEAAERRETLTTALSDYGYPPVTDAAKAANHVRDLRDRSARYSDATRDLEQAETTISAVSAQIKEKQHERAEIYRSVGLEPGSFEELHSLCDQVSEYEAAKADVTKKEAILEQERSNLTDHPDFEADLLDRSRPELEAELREVEERAEEYDAISEQITEITTRIDDAKQGRELEDAQAEKKRALDTLREQYEADAGSMVGNVLAEHVRSVTTDATRPPVFEHARRLLARITAGRYRLDLDEDGNFRATDTVHEKGYSLDELSSGTRVQLLMAVRIAFVEHQEQGTKLPLVLDETLANTDDQKAETIIESIIELAKAGRQVFYFTAQGDEVAKWRAALHESAGVEYKIVDLAAIQGRDDGIAVPDTVEEWTAPDVPAPNDDDHETYGATLSVPPFDPYNEAGSAHLWYLVDDVETLHQLLSQGITTWGQFDTIRTHVDEQVFTDDDAAIRETELHGRALVAYVDAWRHGRGKPVTRDVLEETDAVTDRFLDEVATLAEERGRNAERLIDALANGEVDHFRSDKTEELREYFRENGFIDPAAPLEPDAIRLKVLNRYLDAGLDRNDAERMAETLLDRLSSPAR